MSAYATTAELERSWRPLESDEEVVARQLIQDASAIIDSQFDASVIDDEILSVVVRNMVRRAMSANGDSFALGSTVDAIAWTPSAAAGGLWLTREEKKMLGGGCNVTSVRPQTWQTAI